MAADVSPESEQQELQRVADAVRGRKEAILVMWAERVRKRLPAAKAQDELILYDHLPQFLDHLADGLDPGRPGTVRQSVESVATIHGEARAATPEYSLKQIILEYVVLRQCILDVLESDGKQLPRLARDRMMEGITEGVVEAAAEFTRHQDQLREQFVAILAHDLKNPLSAAKTSMQMIARLTHNPEKVETLASRAVSSIKRIEVMIQELLDTFQIRAGKPLPVNIQPDDLSKAAREAVDELATVYGARFVLNAPPSLPAEFCRDGITRSLENLVNNAVKYGDPHAEITVTVSDAGEDVVTLAVHNCGTPLITEEQAKLFLPFHRAPFARANGIKGWGLGLTLVQGVAKAHGGRVAVDSNADEGTTFTMYLPKAHQRAA